MNLFALFLLFTVAKYSSKSLFIMDKKDKHNKAVSKYDSIMPVEIRELGGRHRYNWIRWYKYKEEFKAHPDRFYDYEAPNGKIETLDCTAPRGIALKWARLRNVPQDEWRYIEQRVEMFKHMKNAEITLRSRWYTRQYKEKAGIDGRSILSRKKDEILDFFGRHMGLEEIVSQIKDQWGTHVKLSEIKQFFVDNLAAIEHRKSEYILKNKDFTLSTSTGRMETLCMLHNFWVDKFNSDNQSLPISREIRAIVDQINKEINGNTLKLTIDGKIDIKATIHANRILDEVLHKLPVNMMVVAMVAAKRGINPLKVMGSLTSSFYRKYNGFAETTNEIEPSPAAYIKNYDFKALEQKVRENIHNDETPIPMIEVLDEKKRLTVEQKREQILSNLKKLKETTHKI